MGLFSESMHGLCHPIQEELFGSSFTVLMAISKRHQLLTLGDCNSGKNFRIERL
jgi:hypothetical protein